MRTQMMVASGQGNEIEAQGASDVLVLRHDAKSDYQSKNPREDGRAARTSIYDSTNGSPRSYPHRIKRNCDGCLMFRSHRAQSVRFAVQYALAEEFIDAVAGVAQQARQNGFVVLAERGRLEFEFLGEA